VHTPGLHVRGFSGRKGATPRPRNCISLRDSGERNECLHKNAFLFHQGIVPTYGQLYKGIDRADNACLDGSRCSEGRPGLEIQEDADGDFSLTSVERDYSAANSLTGPTDRVLGSCVKGNAI
jgi:hypothetical protein